MFYIKFLFKLIVFYILSNFLKIKYISNLVFNLNNIKTIFIFHNKFEILNYSIKNYFKFKKPYVIILMIVNKSIIFFNKNLKRYKYYF
jgi:hypothetical protein